VAERLRRRPEAGAGKNEAEMLTGINQRDKKIVTRDFGNIFLHSNPGLVFLRGVRCPLRHTASTFLKNVS
jgi:hypothetical protein